MIIEVTDTPSQIIAPVASSSRKAANTIIIENRSSSEEVYISTSKNTLVDDATDGIRLTPGQSVTITRQHISDGRTQDIDGAWHAVATATDNVFVGFFI